MKTKISRIGLMSIVLATSLTAVGQVTDQQIKKMETSRAEGRSQQQKSLSLEDKQSSGSGLNESALKLNSRPDERPQRLDRSSSEKAQDSMPSLRLDGGVNAGGGSFATVDGKTVLSDRFYKKIGKSLTFEKAFPKELRDYIQSTLNILNVYGISADKFYKEMVAATNNIYIFVSKSEFSQIKCDHYLPDLNRPASKHVQYGCTVGRTSYFVKEDFAADSILELALAVIHERLWAQKPDVDQRFIADFTNSLHDLKSKQDDQIFRGDRQPLTEDEMGLFDDLEMAARQLGFTAPENLSSNVLQQGGGRKYGSVVIDEKSFVGIGSLLFGWSGTRYEKQFGGGTVRLQNATVLGSSVHNSTISNSILVQSKASRLTMDHSEVKESNLEGLEYLMLGVVDEKAMNVRFAQIQKSELKSYSTQGTAEQKVVVLNSKLSGTYHCGRGILSCKDKYVDSIGANTRIENSKLESSGTIGSNVEVTNVIYKAADDKSDSTFGSSFYLPRIEIAMNSVIRNLDYTYQYKHSDFAFGSPYFEVDTKGLTVDFAGKVCVSNERKVKLQTTGDLLQHCR